MTPLTIVVYVLIITAITLANFAFWLRLRASQNERENQRPIDGLKQ